MPHNSPTLLLLTLTLFCAEVAVGHSIENAPADNAWEADARKNALTPTDISLLRTNRILITNATYKQIFSAYISGGNPLFITSDSLLNAYHVLYEESIYRLENTMAARLPGILRLVLKNVEDTDKHLKGKPALVKAAKRRAMLVTGIALKLMDDSFQFKDNELNAILDREAKKITAADDVEKPEWLGKPDASFAALDYSRYKPRGFYMRSERLKRYFRAVSWLQSIPFRIDKDEELLAILMLGNSVTYSRFDNFMEQGEIELFFQMYRSFIGSGDDWDLMTAAGEAQNELRMDLTGYDLHEKCVRLRKRAKGYGNSPAINDQIRFAPDHPQQVVEPNFRIISAYRTPSALLFQRTMDLRRFKRSYPTGLEVAASLGSASARERLADSQKESLLKTIDSCRPYFRGNSLYFQYLNALEALLDKPEADAPDFMKHKAWEIKSCNTVLAGWAQLSHTWALQAKQTALYLGYTSVPEGFVEPEPEFFSRMAELAETTQSLLKGAGAFEPVYDDAIPAIEKFMGLLEGVEDNDSFQEKLANLPYEEMTIVEMPSMLMRMNTTKVKDGSAAYFKEQRQWLDSLVTDMKQGAIDRHPNVKNMLKAYYFDLEVMWQQLERVSRRLEAIAHKQLRHAELNSSEVDFIKQYGETIAHIMLYGGNSYQTTRDDAPRVVDVFANPQEKGYLSVGVARPRKMLVLYPWKGKTILCVGAVMPYYEFVSTSRLTDEAWRKKLDSANRPALPQWMSPLMSEGGLSKPDLMEKE